MEDLFKDCVPAALYDDNIFSIVKYNKKKKVFYRLESSIPYSADNKQIFEIASIDKALIPEELWEFMN